MELRAKIENGKYIGEKPDFTKFEGKEILLSVKEYKPTRSQPQNKYYWGVVLRYISGETGHTPEELHEIFKQKYLEPIITKFAGVFYTITASTTNQDTKIFADYITQIRNFASSELNIYIPEPE